MKKERFAEIVGQVTRDIPLSCEHDSDGRYSWPKRWEELRKYVDAEINIEHKRIAERGKRLGVKEPVRFFTDTLKAATEAIMERDQKRNDWKDKIRLSDGGKVDSFLDALVDYLETLASDNRRIEACNNIIKICRNISVELQRER